MVYNTDFHTEDDNQKVLGLLEEFQTVDYTTSGASSENEEKVVEKLLNLIGNYVDLSTFEVQDPDAPSYMKFRKIFIKSGDTLRMISHHKGLRNLFKSE